MKTLIKNAKVATSEAVFPADVLIDETRIARVGPDLTDPEARVIDAAGKYLLPGGVDVHTHFDLLSGSVRTADDFHSGTVAAACGGTTSIVDHLAFGPDGCRLGHQIEAYHELAREAVVDYGFHGVIQHVDNAVLDDMAALIPAGVTSHKIYLTYGYKLDDPDILRVLARAGELGLVVCVHCENDAAIRFLTARLLAEGKVAPRYHPVSRPPECEAEAVGRMLMLAKMAGDAPVYIVHLSSEMGLDIIHRARARGQRHVFAETCPQYLFLDDGKYQDDAEGLKYIMAPPLRRADDIAAMWRGLVDGGIDAVATDHCPFNFATQKQAGRGDFSRCPGGAPGVETRMSLLFSEGFMRGRLSLPDVVRLCCSRPAEIFGLTGKGDIAVGKDADLVLFDPDQCRTITHAGLHERVDYTPYEGMAVSGMPVMTMSRGEVIVRDGEFLGASGRGKYLVRGLGKL